MVGMAASWASVNAGLFNCPKERRFRLSLEILKG